MALETQLVHETVDACPMCRSEQWRATIEEGPWSVRRCERCGVGWVSPRLDAAGL
jgi:hypothetical protein